MSSFGKAVTLFVSIGILLSACSGSSNPPSLSAKAGFYEIEPVNFSFQQTGLPTLSYTSSRARIMYSFSPANVDPETKPLFVFFNGGPGCATCTGLLSLNTGPYTLDKTRTEGAYYKANPYSFTQLGNLLYLDAPNTGFSYNIVEGAANIDVRKAEFDAQNFNPFIDAAQMTRGLLRFLANNPSIQRNRVIIVGESYGGVRSSIMMNMLLFHDRYEDGTRIYRDASLAAEIRRHFERVDPAYIGKTVAPEAVAGQFGSQILIQPVIAGQNQDNITGKVFEEEGSIIYRIAQETGTVYQPCATAGCNAWENALNFVNDIAGRDIYKYDTYEGFSFEMGAFAREGLNFSDILSTILGQDVSFIPNLGAQYRENAYRYIQSRDADAVSVINSPAFAKLPAAVKLRLKQRRMALAMKKIAVKPQAGDTLEKVLGILKSWDDYIASCNDYVITAYYENSAIAQGYDIDPLAASTGELFLQNLALVRTFITGADLDLVIYTPAIPDSLKQYPGIVTEVVWNAETDDGSIDVYYQPGSLEDVDAPDKRTIYFPRYRSSGHMVSLAQPDKFLDDVQRWLKN